MKIRPEFTAALAAELTLRRREMAGASPEQFARTYLDELFDKPPSPMHDEIFLELATLHRRRGTHIAIAAPRGHAKSTVVTLAYVLWTLLYEKEAYVVVVSGTSDQAQKLVDHVKRQLESNPRLVQDFPELESKSRAAPWRKGVILLPMPSGGMLASYSAGRNLRGIRHLKHRPTLIIADDLEDKLQVIHEEQRTKLADWFNSTLLKAGTPETNVIVVGTVLHQDSLLATLLDPARSPTWRTHKYTAVISHSTDREGWTEWRRLMKSESTFQGRTGPEAAKAYHELNRADMDRGAEVLWPEVYPYDTLMSIRLREGEAAFNAEYQNDPLDPEQCLFARSPLTYWDDQYSTVDRLLTFHYGHGMFYAGCDPSLANDQTRSDFSAIVILFAPSNRTTKYVIVGDIARRGPEETIQALLQHARRYSPLVLAIETNNFQKLMADSLRRQASERGVAIYIREVTNRVNKRARILALDSEVSQGRLEFSRQHVTLMQQLRGFPLAKHDDGPDALEMAISHASRGCAGRVST